MPNRNRPGSIWKDGIPTVLLMVMVVAGYGAWLFPSLQQVPLLTWDAYRDVIAARHVLEGGGWWNDPTLAGFLIWYPPLNALLMAFVAWSAGADLLRVYTFSPLVMNAAGVLAVFVFMRQWVGSGWAALGGALALLGMPWYITYGLAFPTVMAHAIGLGVLVWVMGIRAYEHACPSFRVALAVMIGVLGWYHPPTFVIVVVSLVIWLGWECQVHAQAVRALGLPVGMGVLSTFPYWVIQLSAPVHNPAPMRYLSPALYHWEMVVPGITPNPYVPMVLGTLLYLLLIGMGTAGRVLHGDSSRNRFLLVLTGVCIAGQVPAYLHPFWNGVPVLVPHEFQLYAQIVCCILIASGLEQCFRWKLSIRGIRLTLAPVVAYGLQVLVLASLVPYRAHAFCEPIRVSLQWRDVQQVIRERVPVDSVIASADDESAFFVVGTATGRKSLTTFETHLNPRVEIEPRREARTRLFDSPSMETVENLKQLYGVQYVLFARNQVPDPQREWFQANLTTLYSDGDVFLYAIPDS